MASAQAGEQTRKPLGWKRIVGYAISVVIVIGIFWWAIPKFADYRDVWAAIKTLTPIETWSLVGATIFNLVTYWWANQAALPGLGIGKDLMYLETFKGKVIDAKAVKGRDVRLYSNGSTADDQNHYTEIEVYGTPAK